MAGWQQIWVALALTFVGGGSTALGGLLVVLQPAPNLQRLGLLQGFAGGLMLCISFFDLVPASINAVGKVAANLWFFGGVALFALVVHFIPEPALEPAPPHAPPRGGAAAAEEDDVAAAAAHDSPRALGKRDRKMVLFSGVVTAIGISLHNFPEGIAVFLGSLKGLRVGASLAFAIALHNIPEGVAVALPYYFATGSRWKALRMAALSGLAEPLGVLAVAFLFPADLSHDLIEGMLGGVGGIMAFLTLHEMLPLAFKYTGHKVAVASCFAGMAAMSLSLFLLDLALPEEVSL